MGSVTMFEQEDSAGEAPVTVGHLVWPGWIRLLIMVLLGVAFVAVLVHFVKRDVVTNWTVLGSCVAESTANVTRVSPVLDASTCDTPLVDEVAANRWPVITFVAPASDGASPQVIGIKSNLDTRVMSVKFADETSASKDASAGPVLVFVAIPPDSIPSTPFTIRDAEGSTLVEDSTSPRTILGPILEVSSSF